MTLQQMAQRVIQAKIQGDLRYEEFLNQLAERLKSEGNAVEIGDLELRIHMMAAGVV